jgi:KEOPS complex subunit Pcc1
VTFSADLRFDYAGEPRARTVEQSVAREAGDIDGDRTRAAVSREGRTVVVAVHADDPTALRAGLNTWCSLVEVAERSAATADTDAAG